MASQPGYSSLHFHYRKDLGTYLYYLVFINSSSECIVMFLYLGDDIRYEIEQFVSCVHLQQPTDTLHRFTSFIHWRSTCCILKCLVCIVVSCLGCIVVSCPLCIVVSCLVCIVVSCLVCIVVSCPLCIVVSCLVCIVVILCEFVVVCVYCCFYFRCRAAGYKSVFGRSCDRPPRHRFFLVSLCL